MIAPDDYTLVRDISSDSWFQAVASCLLNTIFSGSSDNDIIKSDQRTGQVLKRITNVHAQSIWRIVVSASSKILVSCDFNDATVKVVNEDLELQQSLEHEAGVWCVEIALDSTMIASGDMYGAVKVWLKGGVGRWGCKKSLKDHFEDVCAVVFGPNGEIFATGGADMKINVYSVANNVSRMRILEGHTSTIRSLSFSTDRGTHIHHKIPLLLH